jgi:hypothetical protein
MEQEQINIIFQEYKNKIEQAVNNRTFPYDILKKFDKIDDSLITEEDRTKVGPCDL